MTGALARLCVRPPIWYSLACAVAWVFFVAELFVLGSNPATGVSIPAPWDKLVHAVFYGGITAFAWVALRGRSPIAEVLAPLSTVLVGVTDELVQSITPGRSPGLDDLAADIVGATIAIVILLHWRRRFGAPEGAGDGDGDGARTC